MAEAYPQLKADGNFLELQKQLAEIEDQLQMSGQQADSFCKKALGNAGGSWIPKDRKASFCAAEYKVPRGRLRLRLKSTY